LGPCTTNYQFQFFENLLASGLYLCFARVASFDPPIVRGLLLCWVKRWPLRFTALASVAFCFALQAIFFRDHLSRLSFYLSWTAFLSLLAIRKLGFSEATSRLLGCVGVTVLTQVCFFRLPYSVQPLWLQLFLCVGANLLVGAIFNLVLERLVVVAYAIALSFFGLQLVGLADATRPFLAQLAKLCLPFFEASCLSLLVTLRAIGYYGRV
jgi:hypothetical protein